MTPCSNSSKVDEGKERGGLPPYSLNCCETEVKRKRVSQEMKEEPKRKRICRVNGGDKIERVAFLSSFERALREYCFVVCGWTLIIVILIVLFFYIVRGIIEIKY